MTLASGASYRYHNLLREFLEEELHRREPDLVDELHRRASAGYLAQGSMDRAIEHALAATDREHAGRLVTATVIHAFHLGQLTTVARWLARFDTDDFERLPPLAVVAAWIHLLSGRGEEADRLADIADRGTYAGPALDGSASFSSQRAMLRAAMGRMGPADMLANAALAVDQEPANSPWRSHALMLLGTAHILGGDADSAWNRLTESIESGERTQATTFAALALRAGLSIAREDWDAAARDSETCRLGLLAARYDGLAMGLLSFAVGARVAVHQGDLDQARADLVRAQLVRPIAQATPWLAVFGLTHLARAYVAVSDVAGARHALREAEDVVRRQPLLGALTTDLLVTRRQLEGAMSALMGPSSLTAAELRVLLLLPTYLTFDEIGDRLSISRNTVKSHAMSIYGKLGCTSRGEAVERAVELGLLEPYPALRAADQRHDAALGSAGEEWLRR